MHSGVFSTTLIQVLTIFQALEDNEEKPGAGGDGAVDKAFTAQA